MTRASEASAAAQSSGAAFQAWCDEQHRAARTAGWIVWVDHYGPEVRHIVRGRYKIVGPAPPDYLGQLRRVRALPVLPAFDESEDVSLPCDCTQRRAPPLRTCTCGARRGQGHALLCSRVWGDHPGVYYAPASGTDDAARVLHDHHEAL